MEAGDRTLSCVIDIVGYSKLLITDQRATPEAKRDRVANRAVPPGLSRREIAAVTDR